MDGLLQLQRDVRSMEEWYPQFTLIPAHSGRPYWSGVIKPFRSRLNTFRLALLYRWHLAGVPQIWIVDPEVSKRTHPFHPHLNADGSVCAFFVPDLTYDPLRHGISLLVDLAADWVRKHVVYEEFGWWPGAVAPHDPSAVLAELGQQPTKPCVCGSGMRFASCCQGRYRHLATLMAAGQVTSMGGLIGAPGDQIVRIARAIRDRFGPRRLVELLPRAGPPIHVLPLGIKQRIL